MVANRCFFLPLTPEATASYKNKFGVSFKYPSGWFVEDVMVGQKTREEAFQRGGAYIIVTNYKPDYYTEEFKKGHFKLIIKIIDREVPKPFEFPSATRDQAIKVMDIELNGGRWRLYSGRPGKFELCGAIHKSPLHTIQVDCYPYPSDAFKKKFIDLIGSLTYKH